MRTLVIGATGFVGAAVLRRLVEADHSVRAQVRPDRRNLRGIYCETITGDLSRIIVNRVKALRKRLQMGPKTNIQHGEFAIELVQVNGWRDYLKRVIARTIAKGPPS